MKDQATSYMTNETITSLNIAEIPHASDGTKFRYSRYMSENAIQWIRHGLFEAFHEMEYYRLLETMNMVRKMIFGVIITKMDSLRQRSIMRVVKKSVLGVIGEQMVVRTSQANIVKPRCLCQA